MKCSVCGAESGKYPLCRACNQQKEQGLIIKCGVCGRWHRREEDCPAANDGAEDAYLYQKRDFLVSKSEQTFFEALKASVPEGYQVFPQINLAAFIDRTDDAKYRNELFRNVDFLITDHAYQPKLAVEINDRSHLRSDRRARDEKVGNILEEAGVPLVKLWTSYGVNPEYIQKKITETLEAPPERKRHFAPQDEQEPAPSAPQTTYRSAPRTTYPRYPRRNRRRRGGYSKRNGCYVATCVYGSYDCPPVWTLRRFRDDRLSRTRMGRLLIRSYYAVSPAAVRHFGRFAFFRNLARAFLDPMVRRLQARGFACSPYQDPPQD